MIHSITSYFAKKKVKGQRWYENAIEDFGRSTDKACFLTDECYKRELTFFLKLIDQFKINDSGLFHIDGQNVRLVKVDFIPSSYQRNDLEYCNSSSTLFYAKEFETRIQYMKGYFFEMVRTLGVDKTKAFLKAQI